MEVDNQVHEYLKGLQEQVPSELASICSELESLYERRLWHQLTEKVQEFFQDPRTAPFRISMYKNFISDWEKQMNKIMLVTFALYAAKQFKEITEADAFMEEIAEKVNSPQSQEAHTLAKLEQAHFKLLMNSIDAAQQTLKDADATLSSLNRIETVVYASYYRVSADYYKVKADFGQYYKNALLLLSCIKLEDLSLEEKLERTHDLATAALLSDTIYNFGDLLSHPIIECLRDSQQSWMYELLVAFNSGDISKLNSLTPNLQSNPLLLQNLPFLQQKIRLMALVETVFKRQGASENNEKSLSFETIALDTKLPVGEIEHLIMSALSLGLVDGKIDQVSRCVNFQWVQPRYLDKNQIINMGSRLKALSSRVSAMAGSMDVMISSNIN
ncbi:hypothetical protein BB559_007083 [Furculomyces boomerangus]|uniref:PCI domain-containing protein n=2 Tax=Harpellales TaxID=61421 RepID=A0A2T9XZ44_9FUNG|nr:hypothetical protein BB559_007083 [Furculomyces boomerangus]PWA00251.1 hypothetical protein BB558_003698 [Smittium angustum]